MSQADIDDGFATKACSAPPVYTVCVCVCVRATPVSKHVDGIRVLSSRAAVHA